ncbi:SDR family oxidoreductase [Streptomyces alkaliphilus]|uniref:SDR family oxidoreductase n=1 Tax=Streptomyces alkaliphilus TaxID=1472722 RepID=UPI00117FB451|nr:SDR family oxidoreductase [Streptomyces alkaliphilus]MQS10186.1 NAD(P)H-binding protein [Streptomyces alkaliphilus]
MILVTGAGGSLGRLTMDALLARGVPAGDIIAGVRSPERAKDLAALGVEVREADYDRPDTLPGALDGARRVLLISGNEVGRREPQHRAVIDAALAAGVEHLAYTSILHADTTPLVLAPEHLATERHLRASGLPFTLLRNGWYTENYEQAIRRAVTEGVIASATDGGRVASAPRADYAEAAATVLTTERPAEMYELSGDTAWSMADLATVVGEVAGVPVTHRSLPPAEYEAALTGSGVPVETARMLVGMDVDIAAGWLADTPGDLSRLLGRPTTPLRETVTALLAG